MARKIILKEDGLAGSGEAPTGYSYLGKNGTTLSEKIGATVSSVGGSVAVYKVYTSTVTQTNEDAPVSVILENTFGEIPTWSYFTPGRYDLTFSSGPFIDQDKVWIYSDTRGGEAFIKLGATVISATTIRFNVLDDSNNSIDSFMYKSPIEIRYYN